MNTHASRMESKSPVAHRRPVKPILSRSARIPPPFEHLARRKNISFIDDVLYTNPRPAEDHHMKHELTVIPIGNAWSEVAKTDRNMVPLQRPEVAVGVNLSLKKVLFLHGGSLDDDSVPMRQQGGF